MRPNPDIPEDWNILHFPINPRYTKQGTLDGKIGKDADINYPGALEYSTDSSDFKPKEAYALRDRIQKEETGLMTYYEQFNAQNKGRRGTFPSAGAGELTEAGQLGEKTAPQPRQYLRLDLRWRLVCRNPANHGIADRIDRRLF